jgi:hypothetical protein
VIQNESTWCPDNLYITSSLSMRSNCTLCPCIIIVPNSQRVQTDGVHQMSVGPGPLSSRCSISFWSRRKEPPISLPDKIRQLKVDNTVTKPVIQFTDNTWYTWWEEQWERRNKYDSKCSECREKRRYSTVPQPFFPVFFCTCRFIFA